MAVYAIGDVQGCFDELQSLLSEINFDPAKDTLWFTGDLVNRGPKSLQVLRFVRGLGERAITVLGNHDLHLLAKAEGLGKFLDKDTLDPVLEAPDCDELMAWLRQRPMLHHDAGLGFVMVHAGLPPQWSLAIAKDCARELEAVLRSPGYVDFLKQMYGNKPDQWTNGLSGIDRLRFITNAFSRMRYCTADGVLNYKDKGPLGSQEEASLPWFDVAGRKNESERIIFGHWSTLAVGEYNNAISLDSGCLWGGRLTALRLDAERLQWFGVDCKGACRPG